MDCLMISLVVRLRKLKAILLFLGQGLRRLPGLLCGKHTECWNFFVFSVYTQTIRRYMNIARLRMLRD